MTSTNYNAKFHSDLKGGQLGERVIAKWLEEYKGFETIDFGNDNRYDIEMKKEDKNIFLEVKTDRYEYLKKVSTGNIFIETTCSGKLSGIHTTKSDIFVYFFPDFEEAFFIKTKDLKELIKNPLLRRTERSGDGGRVTGLLIDREEFRTSFRVERIKKLAIWKD